MKSLRPLVLVLALLLARANAHAAVPSSFSVQGVLRNSSGSLQSLLVNVTINLYAAQSGGSPLATPINQYPVMAQSGLFTVTVPVDANLQKVLSSSGQMWLELVVGSDVFPRQLLNANVYALYAQAADSMSSNCTGCITSVHVAGGYVDATNNQSNIAGNKTFTGTVTAGTLAGSGSGITGLSHTHGLSVFKTGENFQPMYNGALNTAVTACSPACGSGAAVIGGDCTTNMPTCGPYVRLIEAYSSGNSWCCTALQTQQNPAFCNINTWALCLGSATNSALK
jgi:hypothetical protein